MRDVAPNGWCTYELDELVPEGRPICYGVLKPGDFQPDGVPLVRIMDLVGDEVEEGNLFRISHALDRQFYRSRLEGGEVLLSIQGTIGRVAIARTSLSGSNISRTISRIALNSKTAVASFVAHWMRSPGGQRALSEAVLGTTRDSLNIAVLRRITVNLPPLDEQRRIAEILDSVDESIRSTERLVAKLELGKSAELRASSMSPARKQVVNFRRWNKSSRYGRE